MVEMILLLIFLSPLHTFHPYESTNKMARKYL